MPRLWAGVDAGKGHHHCVVIDENGHRLYSERVPNSEDELLELISTVTELAGGDALVWATDLNRGGAALLLGLLTAHHQNVIYIPGYAVHHASKAYRGDGKSDAKDAAIIADQARIRRDLQIREPDDETSIELRVLTTHRRDLVRDRTRALNRIRSHLLEYFPALERSFDFSASRASLVLLTGYATPEKLRKMGQTRLTKWLLARGSRTAAATAQTAIEAAKSQHSVLPGQSIGAQLAGQLAQDVITLETRIADLDKLIEKRLEDTRQAQLLTSMPGFGSLLAAEFLASTGTDLTTFDTVDRLAGVAGLAPASKDSGRISGNHHRPRRYDRRLLRACYLAAMISVRHDTDSRTFYDRKRREGKSHIQAVLALARRRLNVIWAMFRDDQTYTPPTTSETNSGKPATPAFPPNTLPAAALAA
ncbi:IS110 family transposase [Rathayibacter caricis]|uniref:IS110 family transposase n=1 Tax=Rathayibacter caricis TaxID=110936 RepID=UPI001FB3E57D|nr:IS110 family transposase [Rathayibacter caricis]MCJ1697903.1 IS110 family transposase [Rathayibacter caricis]